MSYVLPGDPPSVKGVSCPSGTSSYTVVCTRAPGLQFPARDLCCIVPYTRSPDLYPFLLHPLTLNGLYSLWVWKWMIKIVISMDSIVLSINLSFQNWASFSVCCRKLQFGCHNWNLITYYRCQIASRMPCWNWQAKEVTAFHVFFLLLSCWCLSLTGCN